MPRPKNVEIGVALLRAAAGEPRPTFTVTWPFPVPSIRAQRAALHRLAAEIEEASEGKGDWIVHVIEPVLGAGGRSVGAVEIELITGVEVGTDAELQASLAAQFEAMRILGDLAERERADERAGGWS